MIKFVFISLGVAALVLTVRPDFDPLAFGLGALFAAVILVVSGVIRHGGRAQSDH